ncbi:peroxisomal biogenesis factor 19 [Papilio machaon]|uniref:peroxisomal biogenesis factor 19 n=1 Tax=Papilio machaon TaxID=76193 RepID=UPI001E665B64|nr:peroxisomal biogenesis factor 19 [Papilio machaon]
MSDNKDVSKKDADPELGDLLDSALQDMIQKTEGKTEENENKTEEEAPANVWNEEFIREAAAQFESNMAALLGNFSGIPDENVTQEQIAHTFSKMAEAAAQVLKPPSDTPAVENANDTATQEKINEVSEAITRTLQNLNTDSENLQTPFSENDLANMFANFNMGEGGQENNMFVPFMQGMMQSLLSKEVLYPSLKDLVERYPTWLAENKGKIEQAEYERFEKQQKLMEEVCAELEPEQESDPEDVKRKRFEVVLNLMQQMQDLGQPPKDLVGDIGAPPPGFAPPTAQDGGQCAIM